MGEKNLRGSSLIYPPGLYLESSPGVKHYEEGDVLCPSCGKNNIASSIPSGVEEINCVRCEKVISITKK